MVSRVGKPYCFPAFLNDDRKMACNRHGGKWKIFINSESKDGFRYGLQKSNLCYTLEDEKFKTAK
ncbi:MAG: hypothetical protein IPL55_13925 [Saprospiraceae bacterium]|nr:hypothetical protein [Saprospiraceae bacterium]